MFGSAGRRPGDDPRGSPEAEEGRHWHPVGRRLYRLPSSPVSPSHWSSPSCSAAFPLYVIHVVRPTGLSLAIAYLLDIHLGFSFGRPDRPAALRHRSGSQEHPAADRARRRLLRGVLLPVPVRHRQVEHAHPGPPADFVECFFRGQQAANLTDEEAQAAGGTSSAALAKAEQFIELAGGWSNPGARGRRCITRAAHGGGRQGRRRSTR